MRRTALIAVATAVAVVAYGRPRTREATTDIDATRPTPATIGMNRRLQTVLQDTVYFGGTTWVPDSLRWEALLDSVWTFDTGVGSSINTGQNPNKPVGYHQTMEGWVGADSAQGGGTFGRSQTCAISGSYSLWAGRDSCAAAAFSYATGQGYGNGWYVAMAKTFSYPGAGNVMLSYEYAVDCEPAFDYSYSMIDTSGDGTWPNPADGPWPIILAEYTGTMAGTGSVTLTPGVNLRSTPGEVRILFVAQSDGSYSDEDGLYATTCGELVIDNVNLSGAITDFSDFESGGDGWVTIFRRALLPDGLSNLASVSDLPPIQVPGPCGFSDSVLVFHDEMQRIPFNSSSLAVSPWIDLRRNNALGRPGRLISYDLYYEQPSVFFHVVCILLGVRWQPIPCETSDGGRLTEFRWKFGLSGGNPWCSSSQPVIVDVSDLIGTAAEQVQIAIEVDYFCGINCSPTSSAPWFDNVRFGVYGAPVSAVPEIPETPPAHLAKASPNPARTSTRISFTTGSAGRVELAVFDVAGRRVRSLLDRVLSAGSHDVLWDTRNDAGEPVHAGLYFYRLTARNYESTRKVVVIH